MLSRRELILTGVAGACALTDARATAPGKAFSFVHITDTHIQPELGATTGVHKAFQEINHLRNKPAFGLVGGDLGMDASMVSHDRADRVLALWAEAASNLHFPLHYSMGNHDLYGLKVDGKPATDSPDYGKGLWKKRLGLTQTYATFDHAGWRFVTLDSAGITPDYSWEGNLHAEQLRWLDDLLRQTPRQMPLVFLTHYPIFTAASMYIDGPDAAPSAGLIVKNGRVFQEMISKHNVKAVFQGHTHIVEEITWLGVRYITGGAVCGDWWKGPRLGVIPEGFVEATVVGENLTWRYVTYGWKAVHENA